MSDAIKVSLLADPVWALLDGLSNVNTFDGEVTIPPYNAADPTTHVYWDRDTAGNPVSVHAYAVYYPGPGWDHALLADGAGDSLDWTFQISCVGGDRTKALWCVERVRSVLTGVRLTVADQQLMLHEVTDPGGVRRDDDETPSRFWLPLQYRLNA